MMVQLGENAPVAVPGARSCPPSRKARASVQNVDRGRAAAPALPVHLAAQPDRRCAGRAPTRSPGGNYEGLRAAFPDALHQPSTMVRGAPTATSRRSPIWPGAAFTSRAAPGTFLPGASPPSILRDAGGIADSVTRAPRWSFPGRARRVRNQPGRPGYAPCLRRIPRHRMQELAATLPVRILSFTPEETGRDHRRQPQRGRGSAQSRPAPIAGIDEAIDHHGRPGRRLRGEHG